jgi:hypothetical protein
MHYSAYAAATDAPSNAIFFKLIESQFVTPNVDGPIEMIFSLRPALTKAASSRALVTYALRGRVIHTANYPCGARQVAVRATAIVKALKGFPARYARRPDRMSAVSIFSKIGRSANDPFAVVSLIGSYRQTDQSELEGAIEHPELSDAQ